MVGFDDASIGQIVPIDAHVFGPVVEFGEMTDVFRFDQSAGAVFVLHERKERIAVFHAPFEEELAVMARLGFIKSVPRVDTAWKQLGHRLRVRARPF